MPDALLGLILGDQVTDTSIIGCAIPDRARPVLRILYTGNAPVLRKPPEPPRDHNAPEPGKPRHRGATEDEIAAAIAFLMRGRRQSITAAYTTPSARAKLDRLAREHTIDVYNGVYRASYMALYSGYQLTRRSVR